MTEDFLIFLAVGFLAQLVDGALGMAYGVVSSTTLLAFGVSPAHASASVHAAEIFTTAASGSSHVWHRNVDWKLVRQLAPAGIIGGVIGAYVLTGIDGETIKPFITAYLGIVGVLILFKGFRTFPVKPVSGAIVVPLGLGGGFADAVGGGGWGPVVTSSLIGSGGSPRLVIGSVNTVEFLVTVSVSLSFLFALVTGHWTEAGDLTEHLAAVAGLIVGGVAAAPLAGYMVRTVPARPLTILVGLLIICLAAYQSFQIYTGT